MKKIMYVLILSSLGLGSCKKGTYETVRSDVTVETLPAALKTSATFRQYMVYSSRVENGILADKYNMKNVNWKYISTNSVNLHSMKELYAVYQKAGMENAQEYIDNTLRKTYAYHRLCRAFPVLNRISSKQAASIERRVYFEDMKAKKPDVLALKAQRDSIQLVRSSTL